MSRAIKPVEVKIPVPTTLLTSTQVAVNPLIRRALSGDTFFLWESSVKFLSNKKPVGHLLAPHDRTTPNEHHYDTDSLFACPTLGIGNHHQHRRHSRHVLSGIHPGCISDGSPLTTGGDDKSEG